MAKQANPISRKLTAADKLAVTFAIVVPAGSLGKGYTLVPLAGCIAACCLIATLIYSRYVYLLQTRRTHAGYVVMEAFLIATLGMSKRSLRPQSLARIEEILFYTNSRLGKDPPLRTCLPSSI